MTAKERLENLLTGRPVDRPPFMPAIYDLKPSLIQSPSHLFGQDEEGIIRALSYEAEQFKADSLTCAYDIYNIEAEAAGGIISRDPTIHMPEIAGPLIRSLDKINTLPELEKLSGRMSIFVNAAKSIQQKYGDIIPVRGGLSGPFSMATKIYPEEELLMETYINPEGVLKLLRYCTDIIKLYAEAFVQVEVGVILFDSYVAPPMISPQTYRDLILPFHREIFSMLEDKGILQRTLIVGGNTLPLVEDFISTGATQFLLDYNIPLEDIKAVLQDKPSTIFRVNLSPQLFINKNTEKLISVINNTLNTLRDCKNLIIGTGILPPNAQVTSLITAKETIVNFYK